MLLVCGGKGVRCVKLSKGKFDVNTSSNYSISYYYTKSDFESDRKTGKLGVFIIQQDEKYKRKVKETSHSYHYYRKDEFDKSGYNITETRKELMSRLHKYKADKKKKEVDAISYEADLKEIKEMFQALKEKLLVKLSEAKTSEDYKNIDNILGYSFVWMVRDIEEFETKVLQNDFYSIEEATNGITHLKEQIMEKTKKLD